jgi:hypothetical protein
VAAGRIESQFPERFSLKPECLFSKSPDVYLRLKPLSKERISRETTVNVARAFWLVDESHRENSKFTYMNVYSRSDRFEYQVYWDPKTKRFVFSNREFY